MSHFDLVIVGAGPVGMYAGILAKMRGIKVLIIEKTPSFGGQLNLYKNKDIFDIPGISKIKASDLSAQIYSQIKDYEVDVFFNTSILAVESVLEDEVNFQKLIVKKDELEEVILTKYILLTTGEGIYNPITLDLPNIPKKNIFYKVDNPHYFSNKKILVLGGGDSAVDIANMLVGISDVSLVHRRDDFRAKNDNVLKFATKGTILKPFSVKDINTDSNDLENSKLFVTLQNLKTLDTLKIVVDCIIVCFGSKPNDDIFSNYLLSDPNGYSVDQTFQTSNSSIYAIGNCASYLGKNKNLASGFGEASNVIYTLDNLLNPSRHINRFYSSVKIK